MRAKATDENGEGTRQRILAAAYALFYKHGFVRVGLDAIAEKAGITKRTLYYHFRSKDDLLAAAMEVHSDLALARIRKWGDKLPADPVEAVEALFEDLGRWASTPGFEGAGYTRLVMELADLPGHPARKIARRHKVVVEVWLADQLAARGVANAGECARQIAVLMEGAGASMLIHGDRSYARAAAEMGKRVVSGRATGEIEVTKSIGSKSRKAAKPVLLSGGNPQIAKADGDAPVQAYIAAMPGWKRDIGRRLDALIERTVPGVRKAVKWNSPFYGVEGPPEENGWFLSFHCFAKYVKIAFFRGASLTPLPPGELKQKNVRYLDIHEADQTDETQLAAWVKQASQLPGVRM